MYSDANFEMSAHGKASMSNKRKSTQINDQQDFLDYSTENI